MKYDLQKIISNLIPTIERAGKTIKELYLTNSYNTSLKHDLSPVTTADIESEKIIIEGLKMLTPNIPIISEETPTPFVNSSYDYLWLIDPLDGTKGFIKKNGEFTINVALLFKDKPLLGVIHIPLTNHTYWGYKDDDKQKAAIRLYDGYEKELIAPSNSIKNLTILESSAFPIHKYTKILPQHIKINKVMRIGSALKFCYLAENIGQMHVRHGPTMEWDIAAGHAILLAIGGNIVTFDLYEMQYNKKNYYNPSFIAFTPPLTVKNLSRTN